MYRKTKVALPSAIRTDEAIENWLEANQDAWEDALDLEVHYIDPRAICDGHDICQIDVTDGRIKVRYRVDYSSFNGCRDITEDDSETRTIKGKVMGSSICFETLLPEGGLSPSDEL